MTLFQKILLIITVPTLLGTSCSYEQKIKIEKVVAAKLSDKVRNWGQKNNLREFNCSEYYSGDYLPALCLKSIVRDDQVPQFILKVSRLQKKSYIYLAFVETSGAGTDEGKRLFSELLQNLIDEFGRDNVKVET